jgi:hypothetical protein
MVLLSATIPPILEIELADCMLIHNARCYDWPSNPGLANGRAKEVGARSLAITAETVVHVTSGWGRDYVNNAQLC